MIRLKKLTRPFVSHSRKTSSHFDVRADVRGARSRADESLGHCRALLSAERALHLSSTMVKATFETPTLALRAETLWQARTSALFMSCERAVFGDLESDMPLYERDRTMRRARYVVRTVPNVQLPYLARKALGIGSSESGKAVIETFDDFEVEEEQSTAPFLYEASLKSYSTFLNPKNSTICGVIRCKSVDGDSCSLSLKLECTIKMSGMGGALEKFLTSAITKKFEMYPKVVERYVEAVRVREMEESRQRALRAAETATDSDGDFHSVCSDPDRAPASFDAESGETTSGETTSIDSTKANDRGRSIDPFSSTEIEYGVNAACCVPPRQMRRFSRASSLVASKSTP